MSGVDTRYEPAFAVPPSRAAAFATVASVALSLVGIVGQITEAQSVLFPLIAAFGLSILATIALAHQRQ